MRTRAPALEAASSNSVHVLALPTVPWPAALPIVNAPSIHSS